MRALVQRVSQASVSVEGIIVSEIERGLLVLLGIHCDDTDEMVEAMARKLVQLRIFEDDKGDMNVDVREIGGSILVVSQFTLYGDCRKGNRPSFIKAAAGGRAEPLYLAVADHIRALGVPVQLGAFGKKMEVALSNDGPTTVLIEL